MITKAEIADNLMMLQEQQVLQDQAALRTVFNIWGKRESGLLEYRLYKLGAYTLEAVLLFCL